MKKILIILAGLLLLALIFNANSAGAVEGKVAICHATESEGNPFNAIEVDDSALSTHLGHGDFVYFGDFDEDLKPTDDEWCEENIPEVSPTPEITPEVTPALEVSPTATPSSTTQNAPVGGDGRSDGKSSCPECTQAPKTVVPKFAPATGRG